MEWKLILNKFTYHLQEYRFVLLIITSIVINIYVQAGTIIAKLKHTEEPNLLHTYSYTEDSNLFSIRGGCLLSHVRRAPISESERPGTIMSMNSFL